jgi:hypothetical protein
MDGMTGWDTNLEEAIQRCKEVTSDESKITIDVITCANEVLDVHEESEFNSIMNYYRSYAIGSYLTRSDAIRQNLKAHP